MVPWSAWMPEQGAQPARTQNDDDASTTPVVETAAAAVSQPSTPKPSVPKHTMVSSSPSATPALPWQLTALKTPAGTAKLSPPQQPSDREGVNAQQ